MRTQIKYTHTLLLVIFVISFQTISMEMISDDSCEAEDMALAHWYSKVSHFVKRNENIPEHFLGIHEKLLQLERRIEEKLDLCVQNQNQLKVELQQMQQKTTSDIVIQRRMDGSVDFQRTWTEFRDGFGDSSGEFFLGLEKLHKLTNSRPYELLIVMEDWENDRRYARYDSFVVGSEAEKYALKQLGKYSGSAGDSLSYHLGQKFSTKDQDNDVYAQNCAVQFTGAWWHKDCHQSNLNGQYRKGTITEFAVGTHWLAFKGYYYSLKFVEMSIRPT